MGTLNASVGRKRLFTRQRIVITAVAIFFIVGLALGLGVGLTRHLQASRDISPTDDSPSNTTSSGANVNSPHIWQPPSSTTWQIVLLGSLSDILQPNVSVVDIDLFDNTAATITSLHTESKKVICYFSAGSYEDFRPDSSAFLKGSDYGNPLVGWAGEWWANTKSENVRAIMLRRLDLAVNKGCDGVDPDNVDAYDNDNGLDFTAADAIDYVKFLADAAHARNLSIGLKNAGAILPQVEDRMQWSVNEQCVQYDECTTYQSFIDHGKPIFHVEYPDDAPSISEKDKSRYCKDRSSMGFSTVLKKRELDDWIYACPPT